MLWSKGISGLGAAAAAGTGRLRHCGARGERDLSISVASSLQTHSVKGKFSLSGSRKLFFDTHALVCLLEENGFTTQQSEIIVSALVKIMNTNMDVIYKDMVTKVQQEITLQQIMSHIGGVKKDMIILEKSEFSALRAENEKIKLELYLLKKQVMDEVTKVRADNKLGFNLEKSRVKELLFIRFQLLHLKYSINEKKLLEIRTEIVAMHAQQDRALTQTDRKIDTEVAGLKTMLESHKLDNIKYLAGSVFTCLTVALGFYRLWI
ncbi:mitochondrial calcium uniporter regulator 1 isoform X1 [Gopherus flavomarginatus]|uniref:mitochondrial calcium uniporter regulator 1 isoform X1 n=1 Tax=Gopherus flavomarginatus TaxID=286002 RepID=UPI0021CC0C1B|nr:mitochondrial calcium uniporter regulator 1 isoform X1 [Gopherus flavomarginatus]